MKTQGSHDDHEMCMRPPLARDCGDRECSCTCMKTTPKSGQARRGLDGAQRVMTINFCGWHGDWRRAKKRPPSSAVNHKQGVAQAADVTASA